EGRATTVNLSQAYEYYVAAMHQGDQDATIRIARFYEQGIVVKKDFAKAIELYVELAKRDNAYAMYKIGIAYFNGDGIKKSLESAYSWLNKALQKGSIEAMNHFRLMGTKSKTDIREASSLLAVGKELFLSGKHEEAKTYLEIAAKEGLSEAYHLLADLHNEGKASETSSAKAFEVMQRAASLGDSEAMFKVAKKHELGEGVPSSFTKAANWYEQAFAKGYLPAREELLGLRGYIDE
ncbi:MAG: sel1 repeat family protein, partial [Bacilli bacterium]|nr:sel1 repeat family protein [Bacilli bacterium]